jgi:hypothetical protein
MNAWLASKPADVVEDAVAQLAADVRQRAVDVRSYAGGDMHFALWLSLVNKRCTTVTGLGVFDLEDWRWRDAYDSGASPKDALEDFMVETDLFGVGSD